MPPPVTALRKFVVGNVIGSAAPVRRRSPGFCRAIEKRIGSILAVTFTPGAIVRGRREVLRPLLYFVIAAVALAATPSASFAQLQVCNRTSANEIYAAVGRYQEPDGWESDGWYAIAQHNCTTVVDQLNDRYYYLYVESNDTVWDGGNEEGSTNFCVRPENAFTLYVASLSDQGDNPNCEKHGYKTKRFMRVDTEGYSDYTFNINN
jgi:uncharacterized membrane protein